VTAQEPEAWTDRQLERALRELPLPAARPEFERRLRETFVPQSGRRQSELAPTAGAPLEAPAPGRLARLPWERLRRWGLVAAGLYPNPVPIADVTTSTTHKTLRGPRGGIILARENPEIEKKLNSALFPGSQGGPLMHVIAAKAVCFKEAAGDAFRAYQQQVISNAQTMAKGFQTRGYNVVSGGTDNHLFLLDLIDKGVTGKDADAALGRANITVNKNAVPNDPRSPFVTSGLRIGTPAVTTRGFKEGECETLTAWMCDVLDDIENDNMIESVRQRVVELCGRFPVYQANAA